MQMSVLIFITLPALLCWGNYDRYNRAMNLIINKTPELTNTGSFEKCWNQITVNGGFIGKQTIMSYFLKSLFTKNVSVNFESAYSFMKDNEDYLDNGQKA